jgi:hypothetical protein
MRTVALLAVVAVAAAAPAAAEAKYYPESPGVEVAKRCRPQRAVTLARTATVLVVRRRDGATQVCYLPRRRVTAISTADDAEGFYDVDADVWDARGRYVSYSQWEWYKDVIVRVRVLDARSGFLVVDNYTFDGSIEPGPTTWTASDHALLANGTVAWIEGEMPASDLREVRYTRPRDEGGGPFIGRSPTIEPGSLALSNRYVYWTQDGAPRSLRLMPMPPAGG